MKYWKVSGTVTSYYQVSAGDDFSNIQSAYDSATLTPTVYQSNGTTAYPATAPKFSTYLSGNYVIDKISDVQYDLIPVTNVAKPITHTKADDVQKDDSNNQWIFDYYIPMTETVENVDETRVPAGYTKKSVEKGAPYYYEITNRLNKHSLTIDKTVSGSMGDKSKDWTFTLELKNSAGAPFTNLAKPTGAQNWNVSSAANGRYSFTLSHGDSLTIPDLPYGTQFSITEKEFGSDGYTTTSTYRIGSGSLQTGTPTNLKLTGDTTVSFNNERYAPQIYGVRLEGAAAIAGLALTMLLACVLLIGRRRRRIG